MAEKPHWRWIDIAKGICIVSIILGHQGIPWLGFVYSYHLPVFFLLAGYTLKKGPLDADYLRQKFGRLMTPYFLTGLAVAAMNLVNMAVREHKGALVSATANLAESLRAVFFASGTITECGGSSFPRMGAIWFLPALFFALALARFLLYRLEDRRAIAAVSVAAAAAAALSAKFIWLPFSMQAGIYACPFVIAGHFLRQTDWMERPKPFHLLLTGGVFLIGAVTKLGSVFYMVTTSTADPVLTPVIALASGYFVLLFCRLAEGWRPLQFLTAIPEVCGKYSLEILCAHLFEMNTLSPYYPGILARLGLAERTLFRLPLRFLVIALLVLLTVLFKRLREKKPVKPVSAEGGRDPVADLLRAGLIVSMVVGHFKLDPVFRGMLYSVHMPAFVIVSGYFHRPVTPENFKGQLLHLLKSLRYYLLFAVLFMAEHPPADWPRLLWGVSYTERILPDMPTVGPVWFFLFLFLVKLACLLIERVPKRSLRYALPAGCVAAGALLGKYGFWLPWSADVALFCTVFYLVGVLFRRWRITEWAAEHPWCYFLLSPLWLYAVKRGSLELAVRNYGEAAGLAVLGACGGFLLLHLLCGWLCRVLPGVFVRSAGKVGAATAYILILHTLYGGRINGWIDRFLTAPLGLKQTNALFCAVSVLIQVLLGTAAFLVVRLVRRTVGRRKAARQAK